ncbi:GyrI-like domain-containing protein [Lentisphaera profundi]|uniref:GyrI-like domain-containing protein n=1 Tax=Lentisphaera profundi TaxID=1658616 RepID=A0ABY7VT36_9BACT|nr:GyrI-like domain-containing protein [Lentisphaera profundi]WDE96877.1 GyrI-like domain-containing protein [Lentisphaera profundi]
MKEVYFEKRTIYGLKARTNNANEFSTDKGLIAPLWKTFNDSITVDYTNGARVFGLYCDYESDHSKDYTVFVGTDQNYAQSTIALESREIPSANYLLFEAQGDMPQTLIDTWTIIWEYFSKADCFHQRLYSTDFEFYTSSTSIEIYISIK